MDTLSLICETVKNQLSMWFPMACHIKGGTYTESRTILCSDGLFTLVYFYDSHVAIQGLDVSAAKAFDVIRLSYASPVFLDDLHEVLRKWHIVGIQTGEDLQQVEAFLSFLKVQ